MSKITIEEIEQRIKDIAAMWDDGSQHHDEDCLWEDVLEYIADGGCPDPQYLAQAVLKTKELDFSRWFE